MSWLAKNSSSSGTDEIILLSFCASVLVSVEDERSRTSVLA